MPSISKCCKYCTFNSMMMITAAKLVLDVEVKDSEHILTLHCFTVIRVNIKNIINQDDLLTPAQW